MFSTIEAIIEKDGKVRLLEPLQPTHRMRALVTLLEPVENPTTTPKRSLHEFIGVLKDAAVFSGDPITLQRNMRDEWD